MPQCEAGNKAREIGLSRMQRSLSYQIRIAIKSKEIIGQHSPEEGFTNVLYFYLCTSFEICD